MQRGFSVIELSSGVGLFAILSAVAVPAFQQFELRARTSEAQTNLGSIRVRQEAFASVNENYAQINGVVGNTTLLPTKVAWTEAPCSPACSRTNTGVCNQFACIGFTPDGPVYYRYQSIRRLGNGTAPPEFCAAAQADLDGDGVRGEFELQSDAAGTGGGSIDCPLTECSLGGAPYEARNCNKAF